MSDKEKSRIDSYLQIYYCVYTLNINNDESVSLDISGLKTEFVIVPWANISSFYECLPRYKNLPRHILEYDFYNQVIADEELHLYFDHIEKYDIRIYMHPGKGDEDTRIFYIRNICDIESFKNSYSAVNQLSQNLGSLIFEYIKVSPHLLTRKRDIRIIKYLGVHILDLPEYYKYLSNEQRVQLMFGEQVES
jgi:hypothetical protein